jgi:hypothetical protein
MHLGRSFGESFDLTNNLEYKGLFFLSSFLYVLSPFWLGEYFLPLIGVIWSPWCCKLLFLLHVDLVAETGKACEDLIFKDGNTNFVYG